MQLSGLFIWTILPAPQSVGSTSPQTRRVNCPAPLSVNPTSCASCLEFDVIPHKLVCLGFNLHPTTRGAIDQTTTMSRRPPNPAAERAAQNQQTIKNLLKLEPNKVCADCKRNKREPSFLDLRISYPTDALTLALFRPEMGELESRRLRLHPLLRHPPRHGHPH